MRQLMNKELESLFRQHQVLDIESLQHHLGGRSRRSIYRDLKSLNSYSSYSHGGQYRTTKDVACFDRHGLWHYGDIGFSRHGSLKSTIVSLVENSDAGYSYKELKDYFVVRLENVLRELVNEGLLSREGQLRSYVYISSNKWRARHQLKKREAQERASRVAITSELIVEILAEVIRDSRVCVELNELTLRLLDRGVNVSIRQVAQVLEHYGVKKTLVSR